ncbi:MAG TPA: bifunctional adenosylcobinamide kinase/adenosylcobinamide-phosphate guanylyltransferase [Polyangia bacterium]|nr:bifunctional adenosylcobinamide kinase/adenosylcobinamide-phosphate guanylyltransferase [Polyangia bacterium]
MSGPVFALVGGGARSGKSRFALARGLALAGEGARIFVATAEPFDDEMRARIALHRDERARLARFETVEAPRELAAAIDRAGPAAVVVVDCLTLWLSNLLVGGAPASEVETRVEELAAAIARRRAPVVVVTNEVGLGLVPETPLGRVFRDVAGRAHQRLARDADELYVAVMGVILRLRPGPVGIERTPE